MSEAENENVEGSDRIRTKAKVSKVRKPPTLAGDCCSSLTSEGLAQLVETYPCLAKYNPTLPEDDDRMNLPPPGKVAFYRAYLTCSGLRVPLTPFYLEVLSYYRIGFTQLHPIAAGKIVRFEMISKAIGQPLSLSMFRKIFLLSRQGDCFTFLYRDKNFKLIETPSKINFWRFYFFFLDDTFLPTDNKILRKGNKGYNSDMVARLNKKVADDLIDPDYYGGLLANCISYRYIPPEFEGLLAMVGISPDWDWRFIPVIIEKSTNKRMKSILYIMSFILTCICLNYL